MDRRIALVALWTLFAGASVGVGFGAAGLVGGPFAAPGLDDVPSSAGGPVLSSTPAPEPTGSLSPDGTARPGSRGTRTPNASTAAGTGQSDGGRAPASSDSASPSRTRSAPTSSRTASPARSTQQPSRAATTERDIQTRGGYVRATCTSGTLSVAASPAVGWQLEHIEKEGAGLAEVRFEQSGDAPGRVDIEARCTSNGPTLAVTKDEDSSSGSGSGRVDN